MTRPIIRIPESAWRADRPRGLTPGERIPTAGDCYRFVLSNPAVDVCMTGPASAAQFQEALDAWERGPMSAEELAWMRRVGEAKYVRRSRFGLRS